MKRFLSKLFKRREKTKVYHINYSDIILDGVAWPGHSTCIGTIRDQDDLVIGQFHYAMDKNFAVVVARKENATKYLIPKTQNSDWNYIDAFIHPELGALHQAHTLSNFLKMEFGI